MTNGETSMQDNVTTAQKWLTIQQASEVSSLSRSKLYSMMDGGQLTYTKVGRTRRIPLGAIVALMEAHTIPAQNAAAQGG
jgi:excisionase family DNA binding protein